MKTHNLFETYPIAGKIVQEYYKKMMKDEGSLSPEIDEFLTDEVVINLIIKLLDKNPRAILDLLDGFNIYATLVISYIEDNPIFAVDINGSVSESRFNKRKDAELHLLENAIKMLNDKNN